MADCWKNPAIDEALLNKFLFWGYSSIVPINYTFP
jgi:hypothetical protein